MIFYFKSLKTKRFRLLFGIIFYFLSSMCFAQSPDSLKTVEPNSIETPSRPTMTYHISDEVDFEYEKPKQLAFVKNLYPTTKEYFKTTLVKKNIIPIGGMVAGTAVLCLWDLAILEGAQKLGDNLGIAHTNRQKTYARFSMKLGENNFEVPFNGPWDLNSAMYFLGDGVTHLSIAGSFWIYGALAKDFRARQTAGELAEAIISAGIVVQVLKHITGRESPFAASFPIGYWRPFPNQADYARNVPHYDAFPSGHLATAMATVTVIAENYPEKKYIRPVGYSLMGLLAYSMLNNGVHWFSDYPLSITMGYAFAKIAVNRGRKVIEKNTNMEDDDEPQHSRKGKFLLLPNLTSTGSGMTVLYTF
ncbi:MAG: phosphatase PAP2 family protein [Bacteroidia bacterium]|nr:phosphatase PAP2 family protein [Bacteroidia bacterium]